MNFRQDWLYVDQEILIWFKYFDVKFSMLFDESDAGSGLIYNVQLFFPERTPFSSSVNKPRRANSLRWSFNEE